MSDWAYFSDEYEKRAHNLAVACTDDTRFEHMDAQTILIAYCALLLERAVHELEEANR